MNCCCRHGHSGGHWGVGVHQHSQRLRFPTGVRAAQDPAPQRPGLLPEMVHHRFEDQPAVPELRGQVRQPQGHDVLDLLELDAPGPEDERGRDY